MDLLAKELSKKREAVMQDFGSRKYVKRGEIEKNKLQRLREEEQNELQAKFRVASSAASSATGHPHTDPSLASGFGLAPQSASRSLTSEEEKLDDLVLPRAEVIRRLRYLKHPITVFGEDDDMRLARLKALLKAGITDPDTELMEGQRNDFLMDLREKGGDKHRDKANEKGIDNGDDGSTKGGDQNDGNSAGLDNDMDFNTVMANFDALPCKEDKIMVYFKMLLKEWEQELEERPEAEKRTSKGKSSLATFKQCARYLNPLFKMCRKRALPEDIRDALMYVVDKCRERDYLSAMDQYIKLAIGNAPWPIGVTMVGIHERSAREKIYTNSVAHIMNDETTRKYLQSVKRLMTLCQRRHPSVPSKSVEFNSLANGSDLQALLAEEKLKKVSEVTEERLLLTAADSK